MKLIRIVNLVLSSLYVLQSVIMMFFSNKKGLILSFVFENSDGKHWVFNDWFMVIILLLWLGFWIFFITFIVLEIKYSLKHQNNFKQFIYNPIVLLGWLPFILINLIQLVFS